VKCADIVYALGLSSLRPLVKPLFDPILLRVTLRDVLLRASNLLSTVRVCGRQTVQECWC
jgi:hypothetical protein